MIEILTDQNQLILRRTFPLIVIQREPFAAQVENVTLRAFIKPENAFGAEHIRRQLVVEEVLEFSDIEGTIALDRH